MFTKATNLQIDDCISFENEVWEVKTINFSSEMIELTLQTLSEKIIAISIHSTMMFEVVCNAIPLLE